MAPNQKIMYDTFLNYFWIQTPSEPLFFEVDSFVGFSDGIGHFYLDA